MATTESNTPISYITTTGLSIFAQAISGTAVTIAKAYFGSDIINTYTQEQLQALNNTVTNGTAGTVYIAASNLITYSFPSTNTVQFKVNLDSTVGNFEIGNWGLVDSNGNMLCITALAKQDSKTSTSSTSVGDNRVYTINIPVTSALTDNIDFSVISLDAASLPEVATENGLPEADTASYPVFHVQDYDGTNYPALASRVGNTWYRYLTYDGILAMDNVWTGTDTFNNTVTLKAASYSTVAPTSSYSLTDVTIPNAGWVASNYISNSLGMVSANSDKKGAGLHADSNGTPYFGYYDGTTATSITWETLATIPYIEGQFLTINNPTGYGAFTLGGGLGSGAINLGSYTTAGNSIISFFSSGSGYETVDSNIIASGGVAGTLYAGTLTINSANLNIAGAITSPSLATFNGGILVNGNLSSSGPAYLTDGAWTTTPPEDDKSTRVATTAYVQANLSDFNSNIEGWANDKFLPLTGGSLSGELICGGGISFSTNTPGNNEIDSYYGPSNSYKFSLQSDGNGVFYNGASPLLSIGGINNELDVNVPAYLNDGAWTTTVGSSDNSTRVATTAYVQANLSIFNSNIEGWANDKFLPLTGGSLSGELICGGGISFSTNTPGNNEIDSYYGPSNSYKFSLQADANAVFYDGSGNPMMSIGGDNLVTFEYSVAGKIRSGSMTGGGTFMVINDVMIQSFQFENDATGTAQQITFPIAFGGDATSVVINSMTKDNDVWVWDFTSTGFTMQTPNGGTNYFSAIAMGPI